MQFPRRISHGPNKGDVVWNELQHSRVLWILHHPRYAGAFCFGRTHIRLHPDGRQTFVKLAPEEWTALIRDAHEGYIPGINSSRMSNVCVITLRLWAQNERKAPRAKVLPCCKAWRYVLSVESE